MAQTELLMPKMGESITEATIIKWLKQEGDKVEAEENVLEVATDKVDSEVPSPVSGVILKILAKEDDVIEVGKPIAIIGAEGESAADVSASEPKEAIKVESESIPVQEKVDEEVPFVPSNSSEPISSNGSRFYSPLVMNIAKTEGISMSELETVSGTGSEGRVTKSDILSYVKNRGNQPTPAQQSANSATSQAPAPSVSTPPTNIASASPQGEVEIIEMDRMRRLIADYMVKSKQTSAHVTSWVEADVTNIVNWRNKVKKQFETTHGEKITFTPLFIEALVKAIKDFPLINVSVDGSNILRKKNINVGMAAALPSGNLIVPVIKNADQLSLLGLTKQVNDLAGRARKNQLKPDEIGGGTYTISNVGTFGNLMGTPIINQPEVAIMAVGAIVKKPVVKETPDGDVIAIRHMMYLSHSYDHRVVDGALGGMFVRKFADYLEGFDPNTSI